MRLALVGQPRSRTNFLLDCLSTNYKVPNLLEPYLQIWSEHNISRNVARFRDKVAEAHANILAAHENFILKIQTTNLAYNIFDVEFDCFGFEQYDSVIITLRHNIVEQLASMRTASHLNTWAHFTKPEAIDPFIFNIGEARHLVECTRNDFIFVNFLVKHLTDKKVPYKILWYDEIPDYVATNLPNANPALVKTEYDYSTIIKNYNEIVSTTKIIFGGTHAVIDDDIIQFRSNKI